MSKSSAGFMELLCQAVSAGVLPELSPRGLLDFHALAARPDDRRLAASVKRRIELATFRHKFQKPVFPIPAGMQGDLVLGRTESGEARIPFKALTAHLLQLGSTGSGKTINSFFWILQALLLAAGIWIFDFFKREYRGLASLAQKMNRKLYVVRWQDFPFNPLEVPRGVHPMEWINTVADLFTSTLAVPPVARNILRRALAEIYKRNSVLTGSANYPTLQDLANGIRRGKQNNAARQAILDRLDTLLAVAGGMLDHHRGLPIEALEGHAVVFELDGLGRIYQDFVVACLLSAAFSRRVATRDNARTLLVSLDEGQRLYSQRVESGGEGPSFITMMTSLVRAQNMMLLVGVQSTHDLARSIQSNSSTKILGRCGDQEDYNRMGRSMGLTREQIEDCKFRLEPGLFVAKLNYGDHQHPFLLRIPLVKVPQTFSDADAKESARRLRDALGWSPDCPSVIEVCALGPEDAREILTADEKRFIECVEVQPYHPSGIYASISRFSPRKAIRLRKDLCRKGLLREWPIDTERGGRKTLALVPTESSNGEGQETESPGRGGILHKFAIGCIEASLHADHWVTQREVPFDAGGKTSFVDLVATRPDEELYVEFELRADYAGINIQKDLAAGLEHILVVTATRKVEQSIRDNLSQVLSSGEINRIGFTLLSSFMKEG